MQYPNYIRQAPHNAAGERYRESRWLIKQRKETFLGRESTFLGGNISILHTIGGRAYPVRHYPIAVRLRDREGHAILCIALNPQSGDFSGVILEVPFKALLHGVLSVVIRSSLGGIREGIRERKS